MAGAVCVPERQVYELADKEMAMVASSHARRVLVVEDDQDNAELLKQVLHLDDHDVCVVHDGPTALEAARRYQPDAVLLDVGLPGMDGFEVARRLRTDMGTDLLLIALTGWGRDEDRQRAQAVGFNHHLVKPVDPAVLRQLLIIKQA